MKEKRKRPTPDQLASFMRSLGWQCGRSKIPDDEFFDDAMLYWEQWEMGIEYVCERSDSFVEQTSREGERVPIAQCMKELEIADRRTLKKLFFESPGGVTLEFIGRSQKQDRLWDEALTLGVMRGDLEAMREFRTQRDADRARKGGLAKAAKKNKQA